MLNYFFIVKRLKSWNEIIDWKYDFVSCFPYFLHPSFSLDGYHSAGIFLRFPSSSSTCRYSFQTMVLKMQIHTSYHRMSDRYESLVTRYDCTWCYLSWFDDRWMWRLVLLLFLRLYSFCFIINICNVYLYVSFYQILADGIEFVPIEHSKFLSGTSRMLWRSNTPSSISDRFIQAKHSLINVFKYHTKTPWSYN